MKRLRHILLGAAIAMVLFCSLGFYDSTNFVNETVWLDDDSKMQYGTDKDFQVYSDTATILEFDPLVAGNTIYFGTTHTDAVNIKWFSDADGDFVTFDEENVEVLLTDVDFQLDDDAKFLIGAAESTDATLNWDNTNAELDVTVPVGSINFTLSAVPDAQYGFEVGSTIAGVTASEGASGYFHTTVTGNLDNATYVTGTWMDIGAATPTANILAAADFGVYESGATLTGITDCVACINMGLYLDATSGPANLAMFRLGANSNPATGTLPDYLFYADNKAAIAYTYGTGTGTKQGSIKIYVKGGDVGANTMYLYLYATPND